jgi:transcriptional regulator with XRE-family HTH domain
MDLARKLRELREWKKLSQGDIEKRTGLLRCYISRVENGHTVPSLETLEKLSRALEVPMYQLFYEGDESNGRAELPSKGSQDWASRGKGLRQFTKFRNALTHFTARDRALLLFTAARLVNLKQRKSRDSH